MKNVFKILSILFLIVSCSEDEQIAEYSLTAKVSPLNSGIFTPSSGSFTEGEKVTIIVTPAEHYKFVEWTGSASGTNNPLSITMDSNKNITALMELKDDDNDGVTNDIDKCPDTPAGETINSDGCSESQKDNDADGVMNDQDKCPDTPVGDSVDTDGCSDSQKDDDSDGVMNDKDQCPNTPSGDTVDENGCTVKLTYIPDDNFEQYLIDSGYDDVLDDYVITSSINTVTQLLLQTEYVNNVADLTGIEDFEKLEKLSIGGQKVSLIDLSNNLNLKELESWNNQIGSIDISKNTRLTSLGLRNNQLSSINVTNNTALTSLSVFVNNLTSIDISKNTALTELNVYTNKLTTIDVSNNTSLVKIMVDDNKFSSLDVSKNAYLSTFSSTLNSNLSCIQVNQNQLNSIPSGWKKDDTVLYSTDCSDPNAGKTYVPDDNFEKTLINLGYDDVMDDYVVTANISSITFLSLNKKNISDLTGIEDFVSLVQLFVQSNNFSTIDVTKNIKLETLILDDNDLTTIDISTLGKLFALTCSMNNLTTINTSNNPNLYTLSCSYNKITSFDLSKNSKLDTFYCDSNQLNSLDVSNNNNLNDSTGENQFHSQNNPMNCIKVNQTQLNNIPANWKKDASTMYSTSCN